MKVHARFITLFAGLLLSSQAFALNTFTWALDAARNSDGYENILNVDPDNLNGYLVPSTTLLNTDLKREWMSNTPIGSGKNLPRSTVPVLRLCITLKFRVPDSIRSHLKIGPSSVNSSTLAVKHFAGSHISAPDPEWVSAAHRNGVKVYGTVYIDSANGTLEMTTNLLGRYNNEGETIKDNYTVPVLDKLDALAKN